MEASKRSKGKGGRPPKVVKKQRIIAIRLDREEHFILLHRARKTGIVLSRYIRETALKGTIKARMTEEERSFFRQLVGISNNLNQLVKGFHEAGYVKTARHFEEYRQQIDALIKSLRHDQ